MKIVITGGHLSPALAVLDILLKRNDILIVGRKYALEGDSALSLEYSIAQNKKIPFASITSGRLQRRFTKHTLFSLGKFPVGFVQSLIVLKKFNPDVVISFGGYVSLSVALGAKLLGIPVVIHEQTLEAGVANKFVAKFAKKICISFESSAEFFPPEKTVLTGIPIRKEIAHQKKVDIQEFNKRFSLSSEKMPILYVTGGSLGSHAINELVEGCAERLLEHFKIIHQTGDAREFKDYESLVVLREELPKKKQERYAILKFVDPEDVGVVLQSATFVVSRSGINTVSELLYLKKPCLLIPLPYGQRQEQFKNALLIKEAGLGDIAQQEELTADVLYEKVVRGMQKKIDLTSKILMPKNGAEKIVEVIEQVVKQA